MDDSDRKLLRQSQSDEVSRCTLTRLSEEEYATLSARKGVTVHEHEGRYWRDSEQFGSLFTVPIHWLMELTPQQATFPRATTLGLKARVTEASENNGCFHLYVIDPRNYGFEDVHKGTRKNIRRACRSGATVELATPDLLEREGYEVTRSALELNGYRKPPAKAEYLRKLHARTFFGGRGLVLAGMVETDGGRRLGGILTASAIESVANADDIYIAPWARDSNIGPRLVYGFMEACQRTEGIRSIVYGRVSDDRDLEAFKSRMGFAAKAVPAKVAFRRGLQQAVEFLTSAGPMAPLGERLYGPSPPARSPQVRGRTAGPVPRGGEGRDRGRDR